MNHLAPTCILLFGTVIPFAVIFLCNVGIIIGVRRAAAQRDNITAMSKTTKQQDTKAQERSAESKYMIRMLVLVSLAYVFFSMPLRFYVIIIDLPGLREMYDVSKPYWSLRLEVEHWVCGVIWHVNYAINFYMYCLGGGKKFRNDAIEVVKYRCKRFTCRT
jgi:hypothetical protein